MHFEEYSIMHLISFRMNIACKDCLICGHPLAFNSLNNHMELCQKKMDLIEIIEDCDKIFLKIDYSATNQTRAFMNGGNKEINNKPQAKPEEKVIKREDKKISDRLRKLMECILTNIITNSWNALSII